MKNRILTLFMVLGMVGLLVGCSKLTKMNDGYYRCGIKTNEEVVKGEVNGEEVDIFTKTVEDFTFEDKEELKGLNDLLQKSHDEYEDYCLEFKDACIENYEYVEHITEGENAEVPFFTSKKARLVENDKDLVSIVYEVAGYWGGAHPFSWLETINYSPELKKDIELSDVINTEADGWKEKLTDKVFEICEGRTVFDEPISYFENYKNDLALSFDSGYFYLTKDAIVFIYGEYAIAPYSEGIQEVEVPFSEIQELLTDAYKTVK